MAENWVNESDPNSIHVTDTRIYTRMHAHTQEKSRQPHRYVCRWKKMGESYFFGNSSSSRSQTDRQTHTQIFLPTAMYAHACAPPFRDTARTEGNEMDVRERDARENYFSPHFHHLNTTNQFYRTNVERPGRYRE